MKPLIHSLTALGLLLGTVGVADIAFAGPGKKGHAHHHHHGDARAFGEPGDPAKSARTIAITMKDGEGSMSFEPNLIKVGQGEQIRFALKNVGALEHEIVIATREENLEHAKEMARNPNMAHDDPNAKRLKPDETGEIMWRFTKAGEFDMSCLIPGHLEAGMTGRIIVTAQGSGKKATGENAELDDDPKKSMTDHSKMDHGPMKSAGADAEVSAMGVVNSVDADKGMINFTHEPVEALGWPKMTMDMPVTKRVDLSAVKAGAKAKFTLKQGRDKIYRVIGLEPAE